MQPGPDDTWTLYWLRLGGAGDAAIARVPGGLHAAPRRGEQVHLLDRELDELVRIHRIAHVVCLLTDEELRFLGQDGYEAATARHALTLRRLPIEDGGVPEDFAAFSDVVEDVCQRVLGGARVLIHCLGGRGRSGTLAGCVLVEAGFTAEAAVERLAEVRGPRCPENDPQRDFLRDYARRRAAGARGGKG